MSVEACPTGNPQRSVTQKLNYKKWKITDLPVISTSFISVFVSWFSVGNPLYSLGQG